MTQFNCLHDDQDLSGCLASQRRPVTTPKIAKTPPAKPKFDDEDLSGCLSSQPRPVIAQKIAKAPPVKPKFDDEDLSGCLVHSGFFQTPQNTNAIFNEASSIEPDYSDDAGSDWLYQN